MECGSGSLLSGNGSPNPLLGRTVPIYGTSCVEAFRATLFVGALGASGYAYAEATRTATLPD